MRTGNPEEHGDGARLLATIVVSRGEYSGQYYQIFEVPESDADAACELIGLAWDSVVMVTSGQTWAWEEKLGRFKTPADGDLTTFALEALSKLGAVKTRMAEHPITEACAQLTERVLCECIQNGSKADAEKARAALERLAVWPRKSP